MNAILSIFLLLSVGVQTPAKIETDAVPPSDDARDILSVLPADAAFVATIRDLSDCDAKLRKLTEQLGLPVSPYLLLKGWLDITVGLNDTGSAAVAMMAPAGGQGASSQIVLALPTLDRTELLTFLEPQALEGGFVKVMLRGREAYVGTKGGFSVFGPDLPSVRRIVNAQTRLRDRLLRHELERFASDDLFLWVNTASLVSDAQGGRLDSWMQGRFGVGVKSLTPYTGLQCSTRIEADGLVLRLCAARTGADPTAGDRETADSLLVGLPKAPLGFAFGLANNADRTRLQSLVKAIFSALTASGIIEPAQSAELTQAYASVTSKITHVSASVSLLDGDPNGRLALAKVLRTQSDARALLDDIERIVRLLSTGPFVDPRFNRVAQNVEYRRAAETSGPVVMDHFYLNVTGFEQVDQTALETLLGPEGLLVRYGTVNENTVVVVLGGGLARFNDVVSAVRAGQAPLSVDGGIKRSAMKLAGRRSLEVYIAIDRWVRLAEELSTVIGAPLHLPEMPELDAPVAVTMHSVGQRETCVEIFVPVEVVVGVKDAIMAGIANSGGDKRHHE